MDKLPEDIKLKILSYTYKPQPKILLDDLDSFLTSKSLLIKMYKALFGNETDGSNAYTDWLLNDTISFMNDYIATMNGYTNKHYNYWKRLMTLKYKTNKEIYRKTLFIDSIKTSMDATNIRLALLNHNERMDFIGSIAKVLYASGELTMTN